MLSPLRHPAQSGVAGAARCDASYAPVPFLWKAAFGPSGFAVTFDEQTDPSLVRAALEDLLCKGALRWVGLDGSNVQVWRTEDITPALDAQQRGAKGHPSS